MKTIPEGSLWNDSAYASLKLKNSKTGSGYPSRAGVKGRGCSRPRVGRSDCDGMLSLNQPEVTSWLGMLPLREDGGRMWQI